MKTIAIIDENPACHERMKTLLSDFCPWVKVLGATNSVREGQQLVLATCPDAILLGVSLIDGTGFDLLDLLPTFRGNKIFLAKDQQCAFKAIKYGALDYLIKPIQLIEFVEAIEKLQRVLPATDPPIGNAKLLPTDKKMLANHITLHTQDSLTFVKLKDIIRLEAEGNYTYFYLLNNKKILVSKSLKDYECLLPETSFFRVHQSHIVRISGIKKIIKQDGGYVEMEDGSLIPISRRKKNDFLEYMQ